MLTFTSSLSLSFHLSCLIVYGIAIGYQATHKRAEYSGSAPFTAIGSWKYISYWNVFFQFVLHMLNVYCRFIRNPEVHQSIRDVVHHSLAFPFALLTPVLFWPVYFYDRDFIYPFSFEQNIPRWLNQIHHSIVILTILLSELFEYRQRDRSSTVRLFSIFSFMYLGIALFYGFADNIWIYGFLHREPIEIRVLGTLAVFGLQWLCFYLSSFIHECVWKEQKTQTVRYKSKKKK